jgi:hypothetical protein
MINSGNQKEQRMNNIKLMVLTAFSVLAGLLSSFSIQAAGHPHSGVVGQVFIGPTCPQIRPDLDCRDRPFQTGITVVSDDGRFVTDLMTDEAGRFAVLLKPGNYVLIPDGAAEPTLPGVDVVAVRVEKKLFTPVTIVYDSGIR